MHLDFLGMLTESLLNIPAPLVLLSQPRSHPLQDHPLLQPALVRSQREVLYYGFEMSYTK